jgi:hypothetical protein
MDKTFLLKSSTFTDITPCNPLKVFRCFGETCRLHLQAVLDTCFHAGSLFALFFDPDDADDMFPPERRLTFNGLHGVISQKIEAFITTALRISNPTKAFPLLFVLAQFVSCNVKNDLYSFLGYVIIRMSLNRISFNRLQYNSVRKKKRGKTQETMEWQVLNQESEQTQLL